MLRRVFYLLMVIALTPILLIGYNNLVDSGKALTYASTNTKINTINKAKTNTAPTAAKATKKVIQTKKNAPPKVSPKVIPPKIKKAQTTSVKYPVVTIEMQNGKQVKVELYPKVAPNTVKNFISLVQKGFYNGLIFHRVIPTFMIQGGCPEGTGRGGPGYTIKGEFSDNGFTNQLKHERGVISIARSQSYDSGGSQFFIMVNKAETLDGKYAAFGKVLSGLEVVDCIVNTSRDASDRPLQEQKMKRVTVETFGVKYLQPQKM